MKYFFQIFFIVSFILPFHAQYIGMEKIDESKITPWNVKPVSSYQGMYHFGDSEWESEFALIILNNQCYAQIKDGHFSEDGRSFIWRFRNLTNVKIKGNKFFSKETNGQFIIYNDNGTEKYGLKIIKPWNETGEKGAYEIGIRFNNNFTFPGKFIQASTKLLKSEDLKIFTKKDLKIMRNEIFARYGNIFQAGGEMEKYFLKQGWYQEQHKDVTKFLTDLEKQNIKLIKKLENN